MGVSSLDLWQLHRIDRQVPVDEQFDAIKSLLDEGIIRRAGLCEVSVPVIEAASKRLAVATVQNRATTVIAEVRRYLRTAPTMVSDL